MFKRCFLQPIAEQTEIKCSLNIQSDVLQYIYMYNKVIIDNL